MNWQSIQERLQQQPENFQDYLDRDILLPLLLGDDTADLSYWLGKALARKLPLADWDDLVAFFKTANWGDLTLINQKKDAVELRLQGDAITSRLALPAVVDFSLEAGFLAQSWEQQIGFLTEASFDVGKRQQRVSLHLRTDLKDAIERERPHFISLTSTTATE
ncbi:YslB family protein [Lapidilactobacillus luobeiensis]|uniref:YslB family protein n=1 Tax=Lapidilactobacillus luobeiensis TaxID=2950371 RepID=UPI0021C3678F|nr:YslB family protein [Lapidilactobacillus luobeiensis]